MSVPVEGLITRDELSAAGARFRAAGKTIVFTNGVFDLLHPGHLALLEDARALGDVLVVAINDDDSVSRLKGPERPIYPAAERAEILLALRWVDGVTVFPEDTPMAAIESLRPDVLVKGAEYGTGAIVGEDFVKAYGGSVKRFPMKAGYATSAIVDRVRRRPGKQ